MAGQKKLHWYSLAFAVPGPGHMGYVTVILSNTSNKLSLPVLAAAREQRKIPEQALMIGASYLGCMTQDEMQPPPEKVPNLIAPTEAYMDGYHAAVLLQQPGHEPPINPHAPSKPGEALPQEGIDWADGFMAGCKRYGAVGKTEV